MLVKHSVLAMLSQGAGGMLMEVVAANTKERTGNPQTAVWPETWPSWCWDRAAS